jgi:hypothetical protein
MNITGRHTLFNVLRPIVLIFAVIALSACSPDWKEFKKEEKDFSVLMPGTPKESSQTGQEPPFVTWKMAMYMLEPKAGFSYMLYAVAVTDYTIKVPTMFTGGREFQWDDRVAYDGGRDALVKSLSGKLISEKEIEISGLRGREFSVTVTKQAVRNVLMKQGNIGGAFSFQAMMMPANLVVANRIVRQGNTLYHLMFVHPEKKDVNREKELFFGSFKLLSAPAKETKSEPVSTPAPPPASPAPADAQKQAALHKPAVSTTPPAIPQPPSVKWTQLLSDAKYSYHYDSESIHKLDTGIVSVWVKKSDKSAETEYLIEIDCAQKQHRTVQPAFNLWTPISQSSIEDSLQKTVCAKAVKAESREAAADRAEDKKAVQPKKSYAVSATPPSEAEAKLLAECAKRNIKACSAYRKKYIKDGSQ